MSHSGGGPILLTLVEDARDPIGARTARATTSSWREIRRSSRDINVQERLTSKRADPKMIAGARAATGSLHIDKARPIAPAAAGFILADHEGGLLYSSLEARAILTHPEGPHAFRSAWDSLRKAIFPLPNKQNFSTGYTSRVETMSGRRKYSCVAIFLDKSGQRGTVGGSVAIVLERHREPSSALAKATSEHFHLTEREQEVVQLLIRGLTNKEIATRMQISPNTVRAFVRMIMGKLGISTRSGVVGMVFRDILG